MLFHKVPMAIIVLFTDKTKISQLKLNVIQLKRKTKYLQLLFNHIYYIKSYTANNIIKFYLPNILQKLITRFHGPKRVHALPIKNLKYFINRHLN